MRVGILTDRLSRNGVTPIVLQEAFWMERLGHTATTLVLRNRKDQVKFDQDLDYPSPTHVRYLSETIPPLLRWSPRFPVFQYLTLGDVSYPTLLSPKKLGKFDVLISHGTYTSITGKSLARKNGALYLPFIHDPMSYILRKNYSKSVLAPLLPVARRLALAVDRFILEGAGAVLNLSTFHSKFLESIQPQKVYASYPGCNAASSIRDARGTFLLAGKTRWSAGTNVEFMLQAFSRSRGRSTLVMAGGWDPSYYESMVRLMNELGIQDRVRIAGLGTRQDLFELYRGARAFLAVSESFGMMCIEGTCFGCPFIMPKGSGVTDLFQHGVHGLFPPDGDLETYVKYIDMLVSDERLSWKMGYQGWQRAKALTWENHAKNLLKIIEETN
jgi:glycosyltransferase involved in cell wall biosynthesis